MRFRSTPPWFLIATTLIGAAAGALYHGPLAQLAMSDQGADTPRAPSAAAMIGGAVMSGGAFLIAAHWQQRDPRSAYAKPTAAVSTMLMRSGAVTMLVALLVGVAIAAGTFSLRLSYSVGYGRINIPWLSGAVEGLLVWMLGAPALALATHCAQQVRERRWSLADGWFRARVSQALLLGALTIPWFAAHNIRAAVVAVMALALASLPVALQALTRLQALRGAHAAVNITSHRQELPCVQHAVLDYGFGQGGQRCHIRAASPYRTRTSQFVVHGSYAETRRRIGAVLEWTVVTFVIASVQLLVLVAR